MATTVRVAAPGCRRAAAGQRHRKQLHRKIATAAEAAGSDPIWFGIFLAITVETAQITPPVGFNLFVLQGMTVKQITCIARVCAPCFPLMAVAVALAVPRFKPVLVTWLPGICSLRRARQAA